MELPKRKKMRLAGYDYSQHGAYFVTICTKDRRCTLGEIVGQGLCSCRLSPTGEIVRQEIEHISAAFIGVHVDKYVVMPNHVHLILLLDGERQGQSPCPTVGDVICAMKSVSTKAANNRDGVRGRKIWQFRFHDHIIRGEREYRKIWQYIDENPQRWEKDCFFSE
jgi:putative transposase